MSCVRPPPATEGFSRALPAGTPAAGSELSALDLTLRALRPLLSIPDVTELCINRPREIFIETPAGWRREELPFADFDWCRRLAKLIANVTRQRIDESSPLLSASLPSGAHGEPTEQRLHDAPHLVALADRQVQEVELLGRWRREGGRPRPARDPGVDHPGELAAERIEPMADEIGRAHV